MTDACSGVACPEPCDGRSTTRLVATRTSGASTFRATRRLVGALSLLVGLAVLPASAAASDRLQRADAQWGVAPEQVCSMQATVVDGAREVVWQLQLQEGQALGHTSNLPEGKAQAFFHDGSTTWFQTASMRKPMELTSAHARLGSPPPVLLIAQPLSAQWVIVDEEGDTVSVEAVPNAQGPYTSAVFTFQGDRMTEARYAGPSGQVVHSATLTWSDEGVRIDLVDARGGGPSAFVATRPVCVPGQLDANADALASLLGKEPGGDVNGSEGAPAP